MNRRKLLTAALVLGVLAALVFTGCLLDLGVPRRNDGQQSQPAGGVLTVKGVKNGTHHEAEVYDYPDDIADDDDLNSIISDAKLAAIGLGTAGNRTLALGLLIPPKGEYFKADGNFLVVLRDAKDNNAPFKYKAAVPFTGGNAAVEYGKMETATRLYTVTFDLNYTGVANPPPNQEIDAGGNVTPPAAPTRDGYTFGGWYTDAAGTGAAWDFDKDTVTTNLDLYAKWTRTYTVTFNTGTGGSIVPALEVPHGGTATRPGTNPTRADCDFDNWYAANADTPYNFSSTVTADIVLYAKWKPRTFAAAIVCMAETANSTSANYTLPSGNETYTSDITPLTTANSPASVTIDGGGRVVTGSANRFTIGSGVTITLKNIMFKTLPLAVSASGTLVLDTGAVVTENAGSGVTVNGGSLVMNEGATVSGNGNTNSISGGVRIEAGNFTMNGGVISGNTVGEMEDVFGFGHSYGGGGVALIGAGTFTMTGGEISGHNHDGMYGVGIGVLLYGAGSKFYMSGGTISNNHANRAKEIGVGGGVAVYGAGSEFHMSGTALISGNSAYNGGGVYAGSNTVFEMTSGEITDNHVTSGGVGGGLRLDGSATLTGDPRIGNPVTSGSGPGWIHDNSGHDVAWP
jgi:uncharacterized repeat protein (TIGR02543 family)